MFEIVVAGGPGIMLYHDIVEWANVGEDMDLDDVTEVIAVRVWEVE